MEQLFDCKDDIDLNDLKELQPACWVLLTAALLYCKEHNIILTITSIKSDRKNVNSVSKTHEQGRAVDISVRGWSSLHRTRLCYILNRDYGDIAAISAKDGIARAAVLHDAGYGAHIHLQVKPGASLGKFISMTRS